MYRDIEVHIKSCDPCQKATRDFNFKKAPLNPLPVAEPFARLHMDIMGPLPPTPEGYKYLLVVVDACTGWIEGFPLVTQDADSIAHILHSEIICRYGAPHSIVSDRGANFLSAIVQSLCEYYQIARHKTSAYHPACNGRVEAMNSVIAKSLRTYCSETQDQWAKFLPGVLLGLRLSQNSSTKQSPFFMLFGHQMRLPIDCSLLPKDSIPTTVREYIQHVQKTTAIATEIAKQNSTQAKSKQKDYHDTNAAFPNYRIGDEVLLKNHRVKKGDSKKLTQQFKGPYKIISLGPNYTYKLRNMDTGKIESHVWHSDNMKPYHVNPALRSEKAPNQKVPKSHSQTDNTRYNIKRIAKPKMVKGERTFQVFWEGDFPPSREKESYIDRDVVDNYFKKYTKQGKPKKRPQKRKFFKEGPSKGATAK